MRNWRNANAGVIALGTLSLTTWAALAQPDINSKPLRENPRSNRRNSLAEQRKKRERQLKERRERGIRNLLASFGFAEPALQDAVIAHLDSRDALEREVKTAGTQLSRALRKRPVDEAQVKALLAAYRTAQKRARTQSQLDEKALDEKVHYSSNLRLEAVLEVLGAIGDAQPVTRG